jgi:hypothetical protein
LGRLWFPELTERSKVGSGNFHPPEVRPIPDSPNLQLAASMLGFYHISVKLLKNSHAF